MLMKEDDEKIITTTCTYDCGGKCPLQLHVRGGQIVRVEPLAGADVYKPCLKGRALRQMIYNPNRLKYPLKRTGARGSGKFTRISWDEALDTIAEKLIQTKERYGNSAILYVSAGGNHGRVQWMRPGYRLLNMFGGCTTYWCVVSFHGCVYASLITYGSRNVGNSWDDLLNSKLIILWAFNPAETWFDGAVRYLAEAKAAGIKIVSVDPRYTDSAAGFAEQWVPIHPGTDTAMLVAMAYVITSENLQDQKYIDTYTVGFDQYREYLLGLEDGIPKTPAWAESITGVSANIIQNLAREYATSKPAALLASWAPGRAAYGEQFHRAAQVLAAMTGNVGVSGGWPAGHPVAFTPNFKGVPVDKNPVIEGKPPVNYQLNIPGAPITNGRIHCAEMWDSILRGKAGGAPADIKFLYVMQANPLSNLTSNTNLGAQAMKELDFVVVHELLMTATAKYADIVLPVTSFVESDDVIGPWLSGSHCIYVNKAIEPLGECKSDLQICSELATRLGIRGYNDKTEKEWVKLIVDKCQDITDPGKFKKTGLYEMKSSKPHVAFKDQIEDPENNPFPTPSGKIEIYSSILAEMNCEELPAIPKYLETWESRSSHLVKEYPLQLVSAHFRRRVHFQFDDVPWLKDLDPHAVWINPIDAEARNVGQGDQVKIFNDRGTTVVTAKITERIMPSVVFLPESGQFNPDKNGVDMGGCVNVLTSDRYTAGGSFACNQTLVQIEKM